MILLTVGTQLPFDRLVKTVDSLAPRIGQPVLAQIGNGKYIPSNMEWRRSISPVEFEAIVSRCSFLIAHAGIGTIVTAQRHLKPLIIFPRLAALKEHRNDHQLATSSALNGRAGLAVATSNDELFNCILNPPALPSVMPPPLARQSISRTIADFVAAALAETSGPAR